MPKAIYKYELNIADLIALAIPTGAKLLTIQAQKGVPCLWAEVDTEADPEARVFAVRGTGHRFNESDAGEYVGSVQEADGALVWHIYEITNNNQEK